MLPAHIEVVDVDLEIGLMMLLGRLTTVGTVEASRAARRPSQNCESICRTQS